MLSSTVRKMQYDKGAGWAASYAIPFKFWAEAEITAVLSYDDGTADDTLTITTDYTLTDPGDSGTLTRVGTWDAAAVRLTIYRTVEITQETDYRDGEAIPANTIETDLDRLSAVEQELAEAAGRVFTVPVTDPSGLSMALPDVTSRAGKILKFDSGGEPEMKADTGETASPFMVTLLDDADASAALTTLGVSAFAKTVLDDADASAALTTLGITALVKTLLDDADTSTFLSTLGVSKIRRKLSVRPTILRPVSCPSGRWTAVAWSPSLSLFCAVGGASGTNFVMTSPDGVTWTARTAAENNYWRGICWSSTLGMFAACATTGTNRIMTSTNGVDWTPRSGGGTGLYYNIVWNGTRFMTIDETAGVALTSTEGATWTTTGTAAANYRVRCAETGLILACGGAGYIKRSTDGATWSNGSVSRTFTDIAYSSTLGRWIATDTGSRIYWSDDGTTWTESTYSTGTCLTSVANCMWDSAHSVFIAWIGGSSTGQPVMISIDGKFFTYSTSQISVLTQNKGIAYDPVGDVLVAIEALGTLDQNWAYLVDG